MNILCVYSTDDYISTAKPLASFAAIPFGISSIATVLKKAGHTVKIAVLPMVPSADHIVKPMIRRNNYRMICFTAVSTQFSFIVRIAETIKATDPSIFTILGGSHATLNPEEVIAYQAFDAICVGEGECAVVRCAAAIENKISPSGIANLWIRKDGSIEKNPLDAFTEDLDALPIIDREMWKPWITDPGRMPSILLGRGCPYHCTYCSNHALAKTGHGKYVRVRSPENIIRELEELVSRYPRFTHVYLEVESFGVNPAFAFALCRRLEEFNSRRELKIGFGVNLAITPAIARNQEFVEKLQSAGFRFVNVGLESGSELLRREVLKRPPYANETLVSFCHQARALGIQTNLFVLMGIPGETLSDFKETLSCVRECNPAHVFLSIFYPYPGTELHAVAVAQKALRSELPDPRMERRRSVLHLPDFPRWRLHVEYLLFPLRIYYGRRPLYQISMMVMRAFVGMHPLVNALYRKATAVRMFRVLQRKITPVSR